jgi:hypothetical protein
LPARPSLHSLRRRTPHGAQGSPTPALACGEEGTGRELPGLPGRTVRLPFASAIHQWIETGVAARTGNGPKCYNPGRMPPMLPAGSWSSPTQSMIRKTSGASPRPGECSRGGTAVGRSDTRELVEKTGPRNSRGAGTAQDTSGWPQAPRRGKEGHRRAAAPRPGLLAEAPARSPALTVIG